MVPRENKRYVKRETAPGETAAVPFVDDLFRFGRQEIREGENIGRAAASGLLDEKNWLDAMAHHLTFQIEGGVLARLKG